MIFAGGSGLGASTEELAARLTPEIVASAHKWAARYDVPVEWVLATILAESQGNPRVIGDYHRDPRGASIGLMQVNTVAEAGNLRRARVTREMLFKPDVNIQWGTMILRRKYDQVQAAFAKTRARHRPAQPIDQLTRLLYTGVDVIKHIYNGTTPDPRKVAGTVNAWQRNLVAANVAAGNQAYAMAPGGPT